MKKLVMFVAVLAITGTVLAAGHAQSGGKTVRINCGSGQRASAGGSYGGVGFSVGCPGGNSTQVISPSGTVWNVRMGVETKTGAWDCAFNGDSPTVSVSCVGAVLTIN